MVFIYINAVEGYPHQSEPDSSDVPVSNLNALPEEPMKKVSAQSL